MIYSLREKDDTTNKEDRLRESVLDFYNIDDNYWHTATRWYRLYRLETRSFQRMILDRVVEIAWEWIKDCIYKKITPIRVIGWGNFMIRDSTRDFVDLCKDPEYDLDYDKIKEEVRRRARERIDKKIKAKKKQVLLKITTTCKN